MDEEDNKMGNTPSFGTEKVQKTQNRPLSFSREDKGSSNVQRTEHLYDTANRLTKQSWTIGGKAFTESYTYRANDGSLNTFTAPP